VTLPGPSGVAWALALLGWAATAAIVGECVRCLAARVVVSWQVLEPVERALLDFYLGGAVLFLVAALPIGAFVPAVVYGLPIAAAALITLLVARHRGRAGTAPSLALGPAPLIALAVALALLLFELSVALPIPTGNTYDSSLLTTYVALLLQHHALPLSFQPYASVGLLYPQGATVWLGWAQLDFGLPAARTSLLVTPLFLALAPLGAYVFGRRAVGTDRAGVAAAVMVAAVGSWTRVLVGGSNDFVLAFPLVLLLAGQSFSLWRGRPPTVPDAAAFGLLLGYSAAMNPVGAEWLLPTVLVLGLVASPGLRGSLARWLRRWAVAAVAAFVALIPTLVVLVQGWTSPGLTPGGGAAPAGTPTGLSLAQFVGSIDPYLFRPSDVWLSPIPFLRLELAILLTAGLAVFLLIPTDSALGRFFGALRSFVAVAALVIVAQLGALLAASTGFAPAVRFEEISSGAELSIWLFTLYTLLAAVPLLIFLERVVRDARPSAANLPSRPHVPGRSIGRLPRGTIPALLVVVIVVPGVVLTPTQLGPVMTHLYRDFGSVTAGDFALLKNASALLPPGSRVLVAPGSSAEFLPGYAPGIVLLYPMVPGWPWINASYHLVVAELTNATLNGTGLAAMGALDVEYVAVTGNNTVLYPAFSPAPLLAEPSVFRLLFESGDAYLFSRTLPS
jgi:hypothetical protein